MRIYIIIFLGIFSANIHAGSIESKKSAGSAGISRFKWEVRDSIDRYVGDLFYTGSLTRVMMVINGRAIAPALAPTSATTDASAPGISNVALSFAPLGAVYYSGPNCSGQAYVQLQIDLAVSSTSDRGNAPTGTHPIAVFPSYQQGFSSIIMIGKSIVDAPPGIAINLLSMFTGDYSGCVNTFLLDTTSTFTPVVDIIRVNDIITLPLKVR